MKPTVPFRGPSLILLAVVHILLFMASLAVAAMLRQGASYVAPFAPAEQLRPFFAHNPTATRVSNFFLFGSAVPFGIFAVTAISRLKFLGVRATGTSIALLGGLTATMALFLSGMGGWVLSVPEISDSAQIVKAIDFLSFLSGGVLYAVGFGLLAAGVSITSHFMRLMPLWVIFFGMALAITGELSWFSLLVYPANFFIPITRFLGFAWMIFAATGLMREAEADQRTAVKPSA